MKNSIRTVRIKSASWFALPVVAFLVLLFTSCDSPSYDANTSKEDTRNVKAEQDKARNDFEADVKHYRLEANRRIVASNQEIEDLKSRMQDVKKERREDYENNLNDLRERNEELKKKMNDYKSDKESDWDKFKSEFNDDMDDLWTEIKDFGSGSD